MNISEIRIKNLFGELNYNIPLKKEGFVTIIHAPNGYGKTTVLNLVHSILQRRFGSIRKVDFETLELVLDNKKTLVIQKVASEEEENDEQIICRVTLVSERGDSESQEIAMTDIYDSEIDRTEIRSRARNIARRSRFIAPTNRPGYYINVNTGETLSASQLVAQEDHDGELALENIIEPLRDVFEKNTTSLILTKRLDSEIVKDEDYRFREGSDVQNKKTVQIIAENLSREIKYKLTEFSNLSQQLDRAFPRRLIEANMNEGESSDDIAEALQRLEEEYKRIVDAGILESEKIEPLPTASGQDVLVKKVLSLYAQDQTKKLQIFSDLVKRIETMRSLINNHFQRKQLMVSRDAGYSIISNGSKVPLECLSSGEQHQLVLFHSLLFGIKKNSLIMIDEPEISLHVSWQLDFLKDLERISKDTGIHFLVATHSPQIINDRWDVTVSLTGEE